MNWKKLFEDFENMYKNGENPFKTEEEIQLIENLFKVVSVCSECGYDRVVKDICEQCGFDNREYMNNQCLIFIIKMCVLKDWEFDYTVKIWSSVFHIIKHQMNKEEED